MSRPTKTLWLVTSLAFIGTVLVLGMMTVPRLLILPQRYDAVCVIRVSPTGTPAGGAPQSVSKASLETEQQRLLSAPAMSALVGRLNLSKHFSKQFRLNNPLDVEQASAVSASKVEIRHGSEASTLEIRVTEENPQMAADMANGLAAVHAQLLQTSSGALQSSVVVPASVPSRPSRAPFARALVAVLVFASGAAGAAGAAVTVITRRRAQSKTIPPAIPKAGEPGAA